MSDEIAAVAVDEIYDPGNLAAIMNKCEHCGGDPAGVVVVKRAVTVAYEQHHVDCPTLSEVVR